MNDVTITRALKAVLAAMLITVVTLPGQAHHSFAAQYDQKKPVKMTGVVTKVDWTNPHVYIYIDVNDDKTKKVQNWSFEMGPPHMLQKSGWKRNSLKIGEGVDVEGWLARDGSNSANARRVTRKSTGEVMGAASSIGQTLTGGQGAAAPAPAP
jgi:hypothetical protein